MVRTAAILAAGMGARLGDISGGKPKGFLELAGMALIERSIENLLEAGIERIVIGTGFGAEHYVELGHRYPSVECVHSPDFETRGSMATLSTLSQVLADDFLVLESDLIYEKRSLRELQGFSSSTVILASGPTESSDEVFIQTTPDGRLVNMSKERTDLESVDAELVGVTRIEAHALREMVAYSDRVADSLPRLDYEHALVAITDSSDVFVHRVDDLAWAEIDDAYLLRRARDEIWPRIEVRDAEPDPPVAVPYRSIPKPD